MDTEAHDNNPYKDYGKPQLAPEKLYGYQADFREILDRKREIRTVLKELTDEYAAAYRIVKKQLRDNMNKAQDNTKKSAGEEILLTYACSIGDEDIKGAHDNYNFYGAKKDLLGKMLDSYNQDQSTIQSLMKFSSL